MAKNWSEMSIAEMLERAAQRTTYSPDELQAVFDSFVEQARKDKDMPIVFDPDEHNTYSLGFNVEGKHMLIVTISEKRHNG